MNFGNAEIVGEGRNVAAGDGSKFVGTEQEVARRAQLINGLGYCGKTG